MKNRERLEELTMREIVLANPRTGKNDRQKRKIQRQGARIAIDVLWNLLLAGRIESGRQRAIRMALERVALGEPDAQRVACQALGLPVPEGVSG